MKNLVHRSERTVARRSLLGAGHVVSGRTALISSPARPRAPSPRRRRGPCRACRSPSSSSSPDVSANDPRSAGPRRLAGSPDGRAVDGLDIELGAALLGIASHGDRLADVGRQGVLDAPVPRRAGRQLPGRRAGGQAEARPALAIGGLLDDAGDGHRDLGLLVALGSFLRLRVTGRIGCLVRSWGGHRVGRRARAALTRPTVSPKWTGRPRARPRRRRRRAGRRCVRGRRRAGAGRGRRPYRDGDRERGDHADEQDRPPMRSHGASVIRRPC